jgi:membrane protein implicated in regulation of membrane protease activity
LAFAIVAILAVIVWRAWWRKRDREPKTPEPPAV